VRARDRAFGIALGILLGLAVIILYLFLGSRSTIDEPDISGSSTLEQTTPAPTPAEEPESAQP
jgi:hypothetical protein